MKIILKCHKQQQLRTENEQLRNKLQEGQQTIAMLQNRINKQKGLDNKSSVEYALEQQEQRTELANMKRLEQKDLKWKQWLEEQDRWFEKKRTREIGI